MLSDCIIWSGAVDKNGYGTTNRNGRKFQAHRVVYEEHTGKDIIGKVIRHTCDNPPCVNPEHLIEGTQLDNIADMVSRNRQRKAKGEKNSNAKLTATDVRVIRNRIREGEALNGIAKEFGVRPTTITSIKTGQNWGWLT